MVTSTLKKVVFSLIMVVLIFGAAAAAVRVTYEPPSTEGVRFEHDKIYWVQDSDQKETVNPHREVRGSFKVSTDQSGLRVPIHQTEKAEGTFRIMTLGCSTTFGWGVEDKESYPARLETHLLQRGHSNIEVINGGQPGYTTFQGLWLWDKVLSKYDPDLVLVGYVVQDARKVAYSDISQATLQQEAEFFKQTVLNSSAFYQWLQRRINRVQTVQKEQSQQVYRVDEELYLKNLRTFRSKIEGDGGRVVHFGFPLERVGYTEQHRAILRLEAENAGVPHFDPSAAIEEATRSQTLYFPQDRGHANSEGCDLIAQMVADFLEEEKLIP